jgi:hypothetical protein
MFVVIPFCALMGNYLRALSVYVVCPNGVFETLDLNVVWPIGNIFLIDDLGKI